MHDGWHISQHEFNCCKSCPLLIEYNTLIDSSYATKLIVKNKIVSIDEYPVVIQLVMEILLMRLWIDFVIN